MKKASLFTSPTSPVLIDAAAENEDGDPIDIFTVQDAIREKSSKTPRKKGNNQKRKILDNASRPNSRPPSHQPYDPANLAKGVGGWIPNDSVDGLDIRPPSARSLASMNLSMGSGFSRPTTARDFADHFIEARAISDDNPEPTDNIEVPRENRRRCKTIAAVVGILIAIVIIGSVIGIYFSLLHGGDGPRKESEDPDTTPAQGTLLSTTHQPPPIIDIGESDGNATYGGTWSDWTTWSECSRPCAVGNQRRNRTCESTELECQGVSLQERHCNTALCPIEEAEGYWSTWEAWSDCSLSCGSGSQIRTRSCISTNASLSHVDSCGADTEQQRSCNTFSCPDCSHHCADGVLEQCSCWHCSESVIGQILSNDNLPIANVTVSPYDAPYIVLNTSVIGGYFTLEGVCVGATYSFKREGYLDNNTIIMESSINITMERYGALQIISNPENKMAITNDRVELCCEASGVPSPDYYEWMRNEVVTYTEYTSGVSTLVLEDVTPGDTAYYSCRASNDYSAIHSSASTLLVKESADEFCTSNPEPNIVSIPSGCSYGNASTIDKGKCGNNGCYGGADNGCSSTVSRCCGPIATTTVIIDCDLIPLPVHLVTECGCIECQQPRLTIYGFAGSRDGIPLQYGDIFWNGALVTNTSGDGKFSFTVERGISRAPVLFVDSYNKTFMDSTYIFEVPSDGIDSQYIRVTLLLRGQVFHLNSSVEGTVEFNSTTITIPSDSFYTSDGQLYTGDVTVSVTTINASNIEELSFAPGDLTTVDVEGDSQQLLSYGMFAMVFEDSEGTRLSIPGEITISIPRDTFGDTNNASDIRVWTLQPSTGLWEYASDLIEAEEGSENGGRDKRQISRDTGGMEVYQATIRGISIDTQWYNFDAISRQTCIVKVRLFHNDRFLLADQISAGQVRVVLQDTNGYSSLSSKRVQTDTYDNGHCMVLPCQSRQSSSPSRYRGYIFADYGVEEMIPASNASINGLDNDPFNITAELGYVISGNKIQVDFNDQLVDERNLAGPFYDWELKWRYSTACSSASFSSNHFRFSRITSCLVESDAYDLVPGSATISLPSHLLLWYDVNSYFEYVAYDSPITRRLWAFQSCYIKVLAPRNTLVQAISYITDERHRYFNTSTNFYGTREDCALDGAVCLQVRPPGSPRIAPYENSVDAVDFEETTRILIRLMDSDYPVIDVASDLLTVAGVSENILTNVSAYENTFQMYLSFQWSYGSRFGIYCNHGETKDEAEEALYSCRNGGDNFETQAHQLETNSVGWAVQFGPPPFDGDGIDIVLMIDSSSSMDDLETPIATLVSNILDLLTFSGDITRMVLVTFADIAETHWQFTSHSAYDPDHIFASVSSIHYAGGHSNLIPYDVFLVVRNLFRDHNREDAKNYIIYISDGGESTDNAEWVRNVLGASSTEPESARIIVVGDSSSDWDDLEVFNNNLDDRFNLDTGNAAQGIVDILQS